MKKALLITIYLTWFLQLGISQFSEQTQISLLTCDSGEALYSTFGHSAIRVFDPVTKYDEVYNYGTFNAFEDNFYIKFLRGKLRYKLSRYSYGSFLKEYHSQQRGVIEQKLLLDSLNRLKLFSFLEENYLPENQYYLYDFFFDNCSSIIRDIAEQQLPGFSYQDTISETKTFRDLLDEHLVEMPWSDFGIDLIIGAKADKNASFREKMFLPTYLSRHLEKAVWNNKGTKQKLLSETYPVLRFEKEKPSNSSGITPVRLFLFLLLLAIVFIIINRKNRYPNLARIYKITVFFIAGCAGLFMLLMWFGTDHQSCSDNWNILWANPFFLVLSIAMMMKKEWPALRIFLILCLLTALLGWSVIPQAYHIAFIPIIFWLLLILSRDYFLKDKFIVV